MEGFTTEELRWSSVDLHGLRGLRPFRLRRRAGSERAHGGSRCGDVVSSSHEHVAPRPVSRLRETPSRDRAGVPVLRRTARGEPTAAEVVHPAGPPLSRRDGRAGALRGRGDHRVLRRAPSSAGAAGAAAYDAGRASLTATAAVPRWETPLCLAESRGCARTSRASEAARATCRGEAARGRPDNRRPATTSPGLGWRPLSLGRGSARDRASVPSPIRRLEDGRDATRGRWRGRRRPA